jgi:hypothetical protein
MQLTLKYRIVELLSRDCSKFYSISDIAKKLNAAYSHAHMFVGKLVEEKVIQIQKIGNVSVCRLDLKQPSTLSYLSMVESRKMIEWARKNPQSSKILERIEPVKDNVHSVLIKNNRIIIIIPERLTGADFSMFRNRVVVNRNQIARNKKQYQECIILHGAEKFWSFMSE